MNVTGILAAIALVICVVLDCAAGAAEPAPPPPVSKFAPAADLIAQSKSYAESFAPAMADSGKFKSLQLKTQKDAHTLAVLGLALAMSDEDHPLKGTSSALVAAAQKLATAPDFAAGTAAFAEIQAALSGDGNGSSAEAPRLEGWQQVAPLDPLMKQVTFVYNRLKRGVQKKERFEQMADDSARYAAILAVVGQVAYFDTKDAKNPDQLSQWYRFCGAMRDAAGEVNAAIHARQFETATEHMKQLEKSCKDCHQVFRKELVEQAGELQ